MNKTALFLVVLAGTTASASALAQSASLRGAGLLALTTTESRASGNTVVETIDSGGGSTGARALRGGRRRQPLRFRWALTPEAKCHSRTWDRRTATTCAR